MSAGSRPVRKVRLAACLEGVIACLSQACVHLVVKWFRKVFQYVFGLADLAIEKRLDDSPGC